MRVRTPVQDAPQLPMFLSFDLPKNTSDELKRASIMLERRISHEQACISGIIKDYSVDWCSTAQHRQKQIGWMKSMTEAISIELNNRNKPELFKDENI